MKFDIASAGRILLAAELIAVALIVAGYVWYPSGTHWGFQKRVACLLIAAGGITSGVLCACATVFAFRDSAPARHKTLYVAWSLSLVGFLAWWFPVFM